MSTYNTCSSVEGETSRNKARVPRVFTSEQTCTKHDKDRRFFVTLCSPHALGGLQLLSLIYFLRNVIEGRLFSHSHWSLVSWTCIIESTLVCMCVFCSVLTATLFCINILILYYFISTGVLLVCHGIGFDSTVKDYRFVTRFSFWINTLKTFTYKFSCKNGSFFTC